jgi:hypothetical protein
VISKIVINNIFVYCKTKRRNVYKIFHKNRSVDLDSLLHPAPSVSKLHLSCCLGLRTSFEDQIKVEITPLVVIHRHRHTHTHTNTPVTELCQSYDFINTSIAMEQLQPQVSCLVDRPLCERIPVFQASRFYPCPSGRDHFNVVRRLYVWHRVCKIYVLFLVKN